MSRVLGGCARCSSGSLQLESDGPGNWYIFCLLCGHREYLKSNDRRIPRDPKVRKAYKVTGSPLQSSCNFDTLATLNKKIPLMSWLDMNIAGGG
jgi:hypothetical protein